MSEIARAKTGNILLIVGRLALAGVFLFAAYAKLRPQGTTPWSIAATKTSLLLFAMEIDSYQVLPTSDASLVARFVPFFELFLGLWLLSGLWLRASSVATTLLLGGFFALMVRTYAMGLQINCGCFGPGERLGPKTLLRDGSLLAISIAVTIGAFLIARRKTAAQPSAPAAELHHAQ
jgi:uncharacterized membrane protein YphA (DoxX/SURF4 family)